MTRRIAFLIYPDFQLLDAAGPIAAFEIAECYKPGSYELRICAATPGPGGKLLWRYNERRPFGARSDRHSCGCGWQWFGQRCRQPQYAALHPIMWKTGTADDERLFRAYLRAAAGLLDGKEATTHWSRTLDFSRAFPKVRLLPDRIFVTAGRIWTSAGITAGIDMSLTLIEDDLGESIARQTARQLVVYHRRPGGQSQFSALLAMERTHGRFAGLLNHVRNNLCKPHRVETLAEYACMSARNFSRAFLAETGMSPAKAVGRLRAETARGALAGNALAVKDVARLCGFGSAERLRRTFRRVFGVSPLTMRSNQP
jgi:transcriptional regulator GlxA family with amidase domain